MVIIFLLIVKYALQLGILVSAIGTCFFYRIQCYIGGGKLTEERVKPTHNPLEIKREICGKRSKS